MAAGFRSPLAFWLGGGGKGTALPPADAGFHSLLGFWIGGAAPGATSPPPPPPPADEARGGDGWHQPYRRGEKRKRGLEWDKPPDDLEARLQRAYARLAGEAEPEELAEVAEAVRPHVETATRAEIPPLEAIDWAGLARDLEAVATLLQAYQDRLDDDDWLQMMLLS